MLRTQVEWIAVNLLHTHYTVQVIHEIIYIPEVGSGTHARLDHLHNNLN